MAVTITVGDLLSALRLGTTDAETAQATRLLSYATAAVEKHAPEAESTIIQNEAVVRLAGYLFDAPTAGRGAVYANALRNSGAAAILLPYRIHRAGSVEGSVAAVGVPDDPVPSVDQTARDAAGRAQAAADRAQAAADEADVDQTARDAAGRAQAAADEDDVDQTARDAAGRAQAAADRAQAAADEDDVDQAARDRVLALTAKVSSLEAAIAALPSGGDAGEIKMLFAVAAVEGGWQEITLTEEIPENTLVEFRLGSVGQGAGAYGLATASAIEETHSGSGGAR